MAIEDFPAGERPFKDSKFRNRLNRMKDAVNELLAKSDDKPIIYEFDEGTTETIAGPYEVWIEILGHQDGTGREWLYEWRASYVNPDDTQGAFLPDPAIRWDMEISPGLNYGLAINVAERESGLTLQRPLRTGSIVRGFLFLGANEAEEPVVQMVFSATNNERQFFAQITGFSAGYYSWTEVYADGVAVGVGDEPQSGSQAVNSYYGPGDTTNVVPTGKIVLMEYLPSDVNPSLVGFCVALEAEGKDIHGDDYLTQPSAIPSPYPPTDGSPVVHGNDGAMIRVVEHDDPANPGQRILRVYHLPPTVEDPSKEYDTLDNTTSAGTPAAGGAVGSFALTPRTTKRDAWGHEMPDADAPDITVAAGSHIEILGTDTAITIQHSAPEFPSSKMLTDPIATVVSGTVAGSGGITWDLVNPSVDSKGHVDVANSTTTDATVLAGSKLIITGTGTTATIAYFDATAGSPTSIGDVMTGATLAIVGSNLVLTVTKNPVLVTTDSYGAVTAVSLGSGTDSTSNVALGDC